MPVFGMVFLVSYAIYNQEVLSGNFILLFLVAIFATAFALMFSFSISSRMLKQIHENQELSVSKAIIAPETLGMNPRVLVLSIVWYGLVFLLVLIAMIIHSLLSRISRGLGDSVVRAIFGTISDVLRMAAFMMVAIMVFEDVGLGAAYNRLRDIVRNDATAALGGLVLTSLATGAMVLLLFGARYFFGGQAVVIMLPLTAVVWLLAIYLEQMFVTALYLFITMPESPLVEILVGDMVVCELPNLRWQKERWFRHASYHLQRASSAGGKRRRLKPPPAARSRPARTGCGPENCRRR
jgi:hypothetical protein